MEYLFWAGALALLGLILATDYVLTRFQHTSKSRRTLALEGGGSLVFASALILVGFRARVGVGTVLWILLLTVILFLVLAVTTVEVWRRRKLSAFDRIIRQLRRDLQKRRENLDRLIWQMRDLERRARADAAPPPAAAPSGRLSREGEAARLKHQVESWEGAGGLARIRALKVGEWTEELEGMDAPAMSGRRHDLEEALHEAADERREAIEVQLALLRLREIERAAAAVATETREPADGQAEPESTVGLEAARRRRGEEEREVARLQAELDQWQRERQAFLRQKIPLD